MDGTQQGRRTLVVAIEDLATAGVVAVEAAHLARDMSVHHIVLVHALDAHTVISAIFGAANYAAPLAETQEEGIQLLEVAANDIRAEDAAVGAAVPTIELIVSDGVPAKVIEGAAQSSSVVGVVLGARRPHALGRLTHADVRSHVTSHLSVPVRIAALQASHADGP